MELGRKTKGREGKERKDIIGVPSGVLALSPKKKKKKKKNSKIDNGKVASHALSRVAREVETWRPLSIYSTENSLILLTCHGLIIPNLRLSCTAKWCSVSESLGAT